MKINITGKQVNIGQRLREYVETNLQSTVSKYFDDYISANVSFSKEGTQMKVDVSVHPRRGIMLQGSATGGDVHSAFDGANERITTRLRKYKNRLVDQKNRAGDIESANYKVIAQDHQHEELPVEDSSAPITIAELEADIPTCTVSGAVMRMDLADAAAVMFRNSAHGGLNMVYRRKDGNIGWVDPQKNESSKQ